MVLPKLLSGLPIYQPVLTVFDRSRNLNEVNLKPLNLITMRTIVFFIISLSLLSSCVKGEATLQSLPREAQDLLADLETLIQNHRWLSILDLSDQDHLSDQIQDEMPRAHYIAELFGLTWETNTLSSREGVTVNESNLDRIGKVEWLRSVDSPNPNWVTIEGKVIVKDSPPLRIRVHLTELNGNWVLTGARG